MAVKPSLEIGLLLQNVGFLMLVSEGKSQR